MKREACAVMVMAMLLFAAATCHADILEAARDGDLAEVKRLLAEGADVNTGDLEGATALHWAATEGHWEVTKLLLQEGAEVNAEKKFMETPLHWAGFGGHIEAVRVLLEYGADTNARDDVHATPLYHAAKHGHVDVAELLLEHGARWTFESAVLLGRVDQVTDFLRRGADPNAEGLVARGIGPDDETPLYLAAGNGHLAVARLLIERGAEPGPMTLVAAAAGGHTAVAKLLLDHGAELSGRESWGEAPLHLAAGGGHGEMVQLLLEVGADVNVVNANGLTPLHEAAEEGHAEVAALLLERGADVGAKSEEGAMPLHRAAAAGHAEIVELLLTWAADVSASDEKKRTPLHAAAIGGDTKVIETLLAHDARPDATDAEGLTPLSLATECSNEGAAELLAEASGWTAHAACLLGRVRKVRELLIHGGVDVNARDSRGRTPLHCAVQAGHAILAERLLEEGADVSARDAEGRTPLCVAAARCEAELVSLLAKNDADVRGDGRVLWAALSGAEETPARDTAVARLLLQLGANPNAPGQGRHLAPLYWAAEFDDLRLARTLLKLGARVDGVTELPEELPMNRDADMSAPLHIAALLGSAEVARLLLEQGADPNRSDPEGYPPLFKTMWDEYSDEAHDEVARLLLEHGADPNVTAGRGTALQRAVSLGREELVKILLEHDADPHIEDDEGRTLLDHAIDSSWKVARMLLEAGVEDWTLEAAVVLGETERVRRFLGAGEHRDLPGLVETAVFQGHAEIARLLLEQGAHISALDDLIGALLHHAASWGITEVIPVLLEHGADVNGRGRGGRTVLHEAAAEGRVGAARMLLRHGADPTIRNDAGKTALDVALEYGCIDVADVIRTHM